MVSGVRVGCFPGAVFEDEERLKQRDHHRFAEGLERERGKQDEVVGFRCPQVRDGAGERFGGERDVSVGEEDEFGLRLLRAKPHGVGLA